jgi:hypothetical protein
LSGRGPDRNAPFTIVVNDKVELNDEHRRRITKHIGEVSGHDVGDADVVFMRWHEVVGLVVEAQEKHQLKTIEALAADMAHRS